jgi:hypothetical protein
VRNTIHFADPLFSTQRFCSGYIGYLSWEEGTYRLYWGNDLPSFSDKLKGGLQPFFSNSWSFLKQHLWWVFVDLRRRTGDLKSGEYHTYLTGISAAVSLTIVAFAGIYRFQARMVHRYAPRVFQREKLLSHRMRWLVLVIRSIHSRILGVLEYWYDARLYLVVFTGALLLGFLSLVWQPINRMVFPISGLIITIGWVSYHTFFRCLLGRLRWCRIASSLLLLPLMVMINWHSISVTRDSYEKGGYPYRDGARAWIDTGRWIQANLPGSVTMTRNPWELHFYSEEKAVQIPLAPLEDVIRAAKYYGVTHLIPETARPALNPWLSGEIPGLELVYSKGLKLYEINYEEIPDLVTDVKQ